MSFTEVPVKLTVTFAPFNLVYAKPRAEAQRVTDFPHLPA